MPPPAGVRNVSGAVNSPPDSVAYLCDFIDDLVIGREDVVCELNFSDRSKTIQAHAHSDGGNATFGQRRVEHSVFSKLGLQAVSYPKYSAEETDVFTENNDVWVLLKLNLKG